MQLYFVHALHAQRRKRAQAHVQRDARNLHTPRRESIENLRREVQPGRGRGHRSALAGKDGLIALAIFRRIAAVNVCGSGMWPMRSRMAKKSSHRRKLEQPLAEWAALQHLGFKQQFRRRRGKHQPLADGDFAPRPHQRPPAILPRRLRSASLRCGP